MITFFNTNLISLSIQYKSIASNAKQKAFFTITINSFFLILIHPLFVSRSYWELKKPDAGIAPTHEGKNMIYSTNTPLY